VNPRSGAARLDGAQLVLLGALLALAVVAWLVTTARMRGMESMPGMDLGALDFYVTVWVVMMVAMMFPAVAPTVLAYNRLRQGVADATGLFVAGYLVVWAIAGLAAYALYGLVRAVDPPFLAWDEAGRYVAGGVIVAAAVYQVMALKQACLGYCRTPMVVLAERRRDGRAGALGLGIRYGAWCFGCCWALFAALFALGVMSVGWMALITVFIVAERLLPWPTAARWAVAVSLLALGLGVAFFSADVPGFAEPAGGGGMHGV
jgi:predicted metal-binding membrane protein